MFDPSTLSGVCIVAGHYGVGKSNLALNLAHDAARAGRKVTLVDLDIVNPYFRSSDYARGLAEAGVEVIAPLFAGTSLDSPGLSGKLISAVEAARAEEGRLLVIDAGGDDAGATALGRFAQCIAAGDYLFCYVVNAYRNLTRTPEEAAALLPEIQGVSHLQATHIVNNSHLKGLTDDAIIQDARDFGLRVAALTGLPLLCQTVPQTCDFPAEKEYEADGDRVSYYPVGIYVTTPWE